MLWCNAVVADKLPNEFKSDLLGTGKKKLDDNYTHHYNWRETNNIP